MVSPPFEFVPPCREWAIRRKVKLLGTCGGPAHLSGESLEAVYPKELRCQTQEAMLKAEFEEATRITPPPTQEPENKIKCPANCVCEVSGLFNENVWIYKGISCFILLVDCTKLSCPLLYFSMFDLKVQSQLKCLPVLSPYWGGNDLVSR